MIFKNKTVKTLIKEQKQYIKEYIGASNASSASTYDQNSNITSKNIAAMTAELWKPLNIGLNRQMLYDRITKMFGRELAEEYIQQLSDNIIYSHDETSLNPYCASISMYPFLLNGLDAFNGISDAPKHLSSFCGSFVNLMYACTAQLAGAVGTPEWILMFDHFACKDYGVDYLETNKHDIDQWLQHVVYGLNQPTARVSQSVFWNIAIYDSFFFETIFDDFIFPDMTKPDWSSVSKLQKYFLKFIRKEREKKLLTFPVITVHSLNDGKNPKDEETSKFLAEELSKGNSFFVYTSETADSLSSCCRLRNELQENVFSSTLGAGGVSTGSVNVITININRLTQLGMDLESEVKFVQKIQVAYRTLIEDYDDAGLLDLFSGGFLSLKKLFSTIGVNGVLEAAESLGMVAGNNEEYIDFVSSTLKTIYDANIEGRKEYGIMFNSECVPAESLGVRWYKKDKKDGFKVNPDRNCYNSYFYDPADEQATIIDKMILQGGEIAKNLDGGSALHLNLMEHPTKEQAYNLFCTGIRTGNQFFTINVRGTYCDDCKFITNETKFDCPNCGSKNISHMTRVIGYQKLIKNFAEPRQTEAFNRCYNKI